MIIDYIYYTDANGYFENMVKISITDDLSGDIIEELEDVSDTIGKSVDYIYETIVSRKPAVVELINDSRSLVRFLNVYGIHIDYDGNVHYL